MLLDYKDEAMCILTWRMLTWNGWPRTEHAEGSLGLNPMLQWNATRQQLCLLAFTYLYVTIYVGHILDRSLLEIGTQLKYSQLWVENLCE